MNVAEHIIALEHTALDHWIRADPDGYLELYRNDATYFDPFVGKRVDGREGLVARLAPMHGVDLPFTEPRYDMIDPVVQLEGGSSTRTGRSRSLRRPP